MIDAAQQRLARFAVHPLEHELAQWRGEGLAKEFCAGASQGVSSDFVEKVENLGFEFGLALLHAIVQTTETFPMASDPR